MLDFTDEVYEEILIEANRRFRKYDAAIRGQVIRNEDFIDYWIARVAYEWAKGIV